MMRVVIVFLMLIPATVVATHDSEHVSTTVVKSEMASSCIEEARWWYDAADAAFDDGMDDRASLYYDRANSYVMRSVAGLPCDEDRDLIKDAYEHGSRPTSGFGLVVVLVALVSIVVFVRSRNTGNGG